MLLHVLIIVSTFITSHWRLGNMRERVAQHRKCGLEAKAMFLKWINSDEAMLRFTVTFVASDTNWIVDYSVPLFLYCWDAKGCVRVINPLVSIKLQDAFVLEHVGSAVVEFHTAIPGEATVVAIEFGNSGLLSNYLIIKR